MTNSKRATVFVSHASVDLRLAQSFVDLLEKSFDGTDRGDVVCTSLDGHKLSFGDVPANTLLKKLKNSLVVGLLTPSSTQNSWVLFELGAAWGLSKPVIPVLFGLTRSDLPAALSGAVAAQATSVPDILKIVDQIGDALQWKRSALPRIQAAAEHFAQASAMKPDTPPERFLFREELIRMLPWSKVSEEVNDTLYIWAWSGAAALNQRTRSTLLSLLAQKKKIKFMILNAEKAKAASISLQMNPVCSWTSEEVRKDIAQGRKTLIDFRAALTSEQKELFYLRETDWFMAWSGLAIDPDRPAGMLQIESYLYYYGESVPEGVDIPRGNHLDFRPNLLLTRNSKFFQPYWYSIERMWKAATSIPEL